MSSQPNIFVTPERYMGLERKAEFKSEYFDGEIFAMAGAGRKHNLLAGRAFAIIEVAFRDRDCEVYGSDMRVCVSPSTGLYTYPDISAVCGEPSFLDGELDTLLNPKVLIEVLSPTTEAYDRGRKFQRYKGIASLAQYVLIASASVQVEVFTFGNNGLWTPKVLSLPEESVEIASIECSFTIADLYQKTGLLPT
ncbi:MAG: Uma2 family endonuclease [Bryobacteraceae bacterium]